MKISRTRHDVVACCLQVKLSRAQLEDMTNTIQALATRAQYLFTTFYGPNLRMETLLSTMLFMRPRMLCDLPS